ncbi:hypothetical protein NET02_12885 [Thermomicrobiaceae bacterium CFH 74404]|uniref:ScoMcrA-like SRA domain-containing protein n=1 Tax=Thermalbibacter longus TaxID=2951981 RepID=A0AA42BBP2_9BACT|nr:hypothetical protein [Thermalbibacter longus]MCM8750044.1 hypothetical protein [Thermalbibacter longus]
MFSPGTEYRRAEIHLKYGGQPQGGISTPHGQSFILLFSSPNGSLYGYRDGWSSDRSHYLFTGEGQTGNMEFVRGNKAIRDHQRTGKALHLFEWVRPGWYRYVGEMTLDGFEMQENVPDREGRLRRAIIFRLVPAGGKTTAADGMR